MNENLNRTKNIITFCCIIYSRNEYHTPGYIFEKYNQLICNNNENSDQLLNKIKCFGDDNKITNTIDDLLIRFDKHIIEFKRVRPDAAYEYVHKNLVSHVNSLDYEKSRFLKLIDLLDV